MVQVVWIFLEVLCDACMSAGKLRKYLCVRYIVIGVLGIELLVCRGVLSGDYRLGK